MCMLETLLSKPVLIGVHLAIAIIGIDAFLWLLGERIANAKHWARTKWAAIIGTTAFALSWLTGGYYYVLYYGSLVKPAIKSGLAPWAHSIVMETKEHIFLFIIPLAMTVVISALLNKEKFDDGNFRKSIITITVLIIILALSVGAMGYIVSAAARWGVV